jgi:hypothetical protein
MCIGPMIPIVTICGVRRRRAAGKLKETVRGVMPVINSFALLVWLLKFSTETLQKQDDTTRRNDCAVTVSVLTALRNRKSFAPDRYDLRLNES